MCAMISALSPSAATSLLLLPLLAAPAAAQEAQSLRVFLRAGEKTHGPGQHDHPRFLAEWTELLEERGAQVEGALRFPTEDELARTDVLVMYAAEAGTIRGEERRHFEAFLEGGGGLVVVHDAVCGEEPGWFQEWAGGAWEHGVAKWLEGKIGLYFDHEPHPITRGIPHFDLEDEIYYEMHVDEKARVLASSFHDVFTISPQMWVVDEGPYRAFVTLQGHNHTTFSHPAFRALLLRGIAWAGGREVDLFNTPDELAGLRYPPGGPLPPERAHEPHLVHEDFELSLVAAEPLVVNPISLDWDERGRMWVAQTPGYPYKEESSGVPAHDEITILHDDDGDGRMDRSTVFAGGLDLVTSLVLHEDGVIVTAAPDILWLRDTDGDGLADRREVLFTGFGYGDTHATTSNLRWGLDGWIYGTQGYSGGASRDIRSPYREQQAGRDVGSFGHVPNGIFRFRPDASAIETVSAYGSNTWGLDFAPDGELFFTMANGSHLRHVLAPEAALGGERVSQARSWKEIVDHKQVHRISEATRAPYVQIDFVGGFTAASGCTIYSAGAWPDEFTGNHFVCEPTVNLVHRDVLRPEGASYVASKPRQAEFFASTDPWFRPVHTKTGPDGALYVLDFYNLAAVHNDTRGPKHGPTNAALRPDRDRHHGRIWRVQHEDAVAVELAADFPRAMTAERRAIEAERMPTSAELLEGAPDARVRALWRSLQVGQDTRGLVAALQAAFEDPAPTLRKNAALIVEGLSPFGDGGDLLSPLLKVARDEDPAVARAGLRAIARLHLMGEPLAELLRIAGERDDPWSRTLVLRSLLENPVVALRASAGTGAPPEILAELVKSVGRGAQGWAVVGTLEALAREGTFAPVSVEACLVDLQGALPGDFRFGEQDQRAARALADLSGRFASAPGVALALLPLAARVEDRGALAEANAALVQRVRATIDDPDAALDDRLRGIATLLALPEERAAALEASSLFLSAYFPAETVETLLVELERYPDPAVADLLVEAFPGIGTAGREAIFERLVQRPAWTERLLQAVEDGRVPVGDLGPHRKFRLRNHGDPAIARRATALLDRLEPRLAEDLDQWIEAHLETILSQGDASNGQHLFQVNCSTCHHVDGLAQEGAHVGPELTGMGAHGREHLLPFILDPNLSVEAAYVEYVAETLDGELVAGVLTEDAPDFITLSGTAGSVRVRRDELESLRSTGRSPMPTGFEELGPEALRDLLTFLCQGYEDFRVIDISNHVTASTLLGLYDRRHDANPLRLKRRGVVDVFGVPMELLDPGTQPNSNDAIVLKGGARAEWESKTDMPQRVEIAVGFPLQRMHVLGGIAAWGHPFFGDEEPILRWTWRYADGEEESIVLHDGDQFADWIRRHDVPGSSYVEGLLEKGSWGQVRHFSLDPARPAVAVESLVLESFDNRLAPTLLALTAQLDGAEPAPGQEDQQLEVLIVGGDASHDFERWFDQELRATFAGARGLAAEEVEYTSDPAEIAPRLAELDVLVLTNNQPLPDPATRTAIFDFVAGGGGLLLLHPATWYNWTDWPEYNRELVGGGAASHEAYGLFDVHLEKLQHPVLEELPGVFEIQDELYRAELDSSAAESLVLAVGRSRESGESYPVVWVREHGQGRVLCVTLGHDGAAHQNAAFVRLMENGLGWLGGDD